MREYCNPIRLERMRYSHPSIFPSLWDVPISLSHSNNKTHFFFSFLESEIHAKTIEKSNKIQETERREGLRWWFSSSKSERPSLLAVYYGIQGIIGYSNSLELQVQLCLSLSLSLDRCCFLLSPLSLSVSLWESNWILVFVYLKWDKKIAR